MPDSYNQNARSSSRYAGGRVSDDAIEHRAQAGERRDHPAERRGPVAAFRPALDRRAGAPHRPAGGPPRPPKTDDGSQLGPNPASGAGPVPALASDGRRMPGLVQHQLRAAGQNDRRRDPEALVLGLAPDLEAVAAQLLDGGGGVVTHEGQLVTHSALEGLAFGRVDAELSRGEGEDEPPATGVDVVPAEDVPEDGPHLLRLRGVDQRVGSGYRHAPFSSMAPRHLSDDALKNTARALQARYISPTATAPSATPRPLPTTSSSSTD